MAKNSPFLFLFILIPLISSAQSEMSPGNVFSRQQQLCFYEGDSLINTSLFRSPFIIGDSTFCGIKQYQGRFMRFVRNRHFAELRDTTIEIFVDPFVNFSNTRHGDTSFTSNSRGLIFRGRVSKNFYFMTAAVENQVYYPNYIRKYIREQWVIPGLGRYKGFKETGYDYAFSFGQLLWMPLRNVQIEAGHGKQFIGEGYRSMLLSDNCPFYPFLKVSTSAGKFRFVHMYTAFQDVKRTDNRSLVYQRSHGTFISAGYRMSEKFTVSLTEAIIWQTYGDDYNNRFTASYFLPVPFIRPFVYGLGDPNNILLGLNVSWRPVYSLLLYGQYVADDFQSLHPDTAANIFNRNGYQAGLRMIEPFRMRNLHLLLEYNHASPYTYASSTRRQAYAGMNEPLAHPLGANFSEWVFQLQYRYKSWYLHSSLIYAETGKDQTNTHYGSNIFKPDSVATTGNLAIALPPVLQTTIRNLSVETGYIINPRYNFVIAAGIRQRDYTNSSSDVPARLVYVKLSTLLLNTYNDY